MRCIFWCLPYSSRVYYADCRTISVLPLLRCCRHQSYLGLFLPSSCHVPSLSCSFSSCPSLSLMTIRTGCSGGTQHHMVFHSAELVVTLCSQMCDLSQHVNIFPSKSLQCYKLSSVPRGEQTINAHTKRNLQQTVFISPPWEPTATFSLSGCQICCNNVFHL